MLNKAINQNTTFYLEIKTTTISRTNLNEVLSKVKKSNIFIKVKSYKRTKVH